MSRRGTGDTSAKARAGKGHVVRALILVLSLGVFAAACGGGGNGSGGSGGSGGASRSAQPGKSGGQPSPPGYVSVTAGNIALAHPRGWRQVQPPKGWALALEWYTDGAPTARIGVITAVPQTDDASTVAATAFAGAQLNAKIKKRLPDRRIDVPGASGAVRVDYTFADSSNGLSSRGTDVSIVYGDKKAVTVRIAGLENTLSLELADKITRTIAVKG